MPSSVPSPSKSLLSHADDLEGEVNPMMSDDELNDILDPANLTPDTTDGMSPNSRRELEKKTEDTDREIDALRRQLAEARRRVPNG